MGHTDTTGLIIPKWEELSKRGVEAHPAADLFPFMTDGELVALAIDIEHHGQRVPIIMHNGQVLDGRNRWLACAALGREPDQECWRGKGSPTAWVISMNLQRRHLTASQRAMLATEALPLYEAEAAERQRATLRQGNTLPVPALMPERAGESREHVATDFNVSPRYVQDAKALKQAAPDLAEEVRAGDKTITEAKRTVNERKRQAKREQNKALVDETAPVVETEQPTGRFETIALDPPWDWGDEGDVDQFGRARPTYATMPFDDVLALPVADLAADNAHIYLWITNRSLPKGFALLERWGFRYVTCLTWCKPSIGMGNYFRGSTEQVLFGVRGSLPLLRQDIGTWFAAPRGERHSEKPDAFYELVESCSPGPWLEMFSRRLRNGWVSWGAEVNHAN